MVISLQIGKYSPAVLDSKKTGLFRVKSGGVLLSVVTQNKLTIQSKNGEAIIQCG